MKTLLIVAVVVALAIMELGEAVIFYYIKKYGGKRFDGFGTKKLWYVFEDGSIIFLETSKIFHVSFYTYSDPGTTAYQCCLKILNSPLIPSILRF